MPKPATLAIRVECTGAVDEQSLAQLEALLAVHPEAVDLRFARACLLEELGRLRLARGAYEGVLARAPTHFGALMNLGTLFFVEGKLIQARVLYGKAAEYHPSEPSAFVNLGNALSEGGDLAGGRRAYEHALALEPAHSTAHFALSLLFEGAGDRDAAERERAAAFATPIVRVTPFRGSGTPLRLLVLLAAHGGNIVTTLLLDDRQLEATVLVADSYRAGSALPPHDLVFNAIADADRATDALDAADAVAAATHAAIINPPATIRATARLAVAARLAPLAGVVAPRTVQFARSAIDVPTLEAHGFTYPLLVRAPGYHMGQHFELVESAAELVAARDRLPGEELLAIAFLDARGADGAFRKYRALFVDGAVYPLHLAIAEQWKVHYFSAAMRERADFRLEEAAFLDDLPGHLGPRATAALAAIAATLGLDYGGIDFGLDAAGNVLVFEANATMAIYWPEADERFAYRRAAVERAIGAVRAMFARRATSADRLPGMGTGEVRH